MHQDMIDSLAAIGSTHASETVFDLAPVGLMVTCERVMTRCNLAIADIFGYGVEQLVGRSTEMLYPSHEEFEYLGRRGSTIMKDTGRYRDTRIMRHGSGRLFWCAVWGRSLAPETPHASVIWVFDDIGNGRPVSLSLTAREREIAARVVTGITSKQIARDLDVSHRTVEAHRMRMMRKLNVTTSGELIAHILGMSNAP